MWEPALDVPVSLRGGFGGFPVRHTVTGQLGYFKISKFKWDVACANLAALVGVPVPPIEFARVEPRHGAVSHFWGEESLDIVAARKKPGSTLEFELTAASGYLAFIYWIGYGDLRNQHLLWSPTGGIALIDYDDAFTWRYLKWNHLVGPSLLLYYFNPNRLREMAGRIKRLTRDQIYSAFTSLEQRFRFYPWEETRFTDQLFEIGQTIDTRLARYWDRGIVSRKKYPQLATQDLKMWPGTWRKAVEDCPHEFAKDGPLWQCPKCRFYWPLKGEPDIPPHSS